MPKQKKRTKKADLQTKRDVPSLAERQMEGSMSYWLARINPAVIESLWKRLEGCAKDVPSLTTWALSESGTTSKGASQVDATASITPDGCALTFTVKDMSK